MAVCNARKRAWPRKHAWPIIGYTRFHLEPAMDEWSNLKLCDVINLGLGIVLFFSPWEFGLSMGPQWQTASVVGIIIGVLSIAALAAFAVWEEWLNLIAGLALMVSPWLLGFQDSVAMSIDVMIGVAVAALAAFEVWALRHSQSAVPGR
jgi:hypothetical protein